ncbi:helix-turn-helix domain-containing protein [Actinomadura sp. NPDC047616]|uniref:helix-turn-helix domain-containing protein n=1 Tax=Actinomadura sp. NPDC047616 TaxID=3155914 RepID=UPI003408CCAE
MTLRTILTVARRLFAEHGYARTPIRLIANEAGVARRRPSMRTLGPRRARAERAGRPDGRRGASPGPDGRGRRPA